MPHIHADTLRIPFRRMLLLLSLISVTCAQYAYAQVRIQLNIHQDTVAIGRHFQAGLSITYPANLNIIFPDSASDFKPYEWIAAEYIPTQKNGSRLKDSIVYTLRTFEVRDIQKLSLPLKFIRQKDTLFEMSPEDSFKLAARIQSAQDSSLKTLPHTDILPLDPPVDYAGIFLLVIFIILLVLFLIFILRKPFLKMRRKNKLRKEWKQVRKEIEILNPEDQSKFIYQLNYISRTFLSENSSTHLESKTSTELKELMPDNFITPEIQNLLIRLSEASDKILHAELKSTSSELNQLRENILPVMQQEFERRLREIKI